jgi:hypothetical protein
MTSEIVIKAMTRLKEKELAMKNELQLFIPITKIDEEKRLVFGRVTEEAPDSAGEIFDYETSKPYFKEWTDYFQKATDGKSCGNLRAMHDAKKAVGYLPQVSLSDKEKAVDVVGKVVDDDEWKNVLEGVYTGFSQGGAYIKKWYDGKYYRYTAKPSEISLVDYPALKSATFQMVKADGIVETRAFKALEKKPEIDLKKWAGEEISDASTAINCLNDLFYLYSKESAEGDKGQAADLKAVIDKLKNFIGSEIKETTLQEDMAMLDKWNELKKMVEELTDDLVKSHSKETLSKIQGIHDHSSALGAKCNTGKADDAGDLQKIQTEKDEALKKIGTLEVDLKKVSDERDALKKEVEELKRKPEPAKGATKDVTTVTKQDDTKVDGVTKKEDPKDPLDAIKKAHSEPIAYRLSKPVL